MVLTLTEVCASLFHGGIIYGRREFGGPARVVGLERIHADAYKVLYEPIGDSTKRLLTVNATIKGQSNGLATQDSAP